MKSSSLFQELSHGSHLEFSAQSDLTKLIANNFGSLFQESGHGSHLEFSAKSGFNVYTLELTVWVGVVRNFIQALKLPKRMNLIENQVILFGN